MQNKIKILWKKKLKIPAKKILRLIGKKILIVNTIQANNNFRTKTKVKENVIEKIEKQTQDNNRINCKVTADLTNIKFQIRRRRQGKAKYCQNKVEKCRKKNTYPSYNRSRSLSKANIFKNLVQIKYIKSYKNLTLNKILCKKARHNL